MFKHDILKNWSALDSKKNQFIVLKIDKRFEHLFCLIYMICATSNQRVDEQRHLFIKIFQIINEK